MPNQSDQTDRDDTPGCDCWTTHLAALGTPVSAADGGLWFDAYGHRPECRWADVGTEAEMAAVLSIRANPGTLR